MIKTNKTYGIDLDGVCFNFCDAFRIWLNISLNININLNEITSYYWHEDIDDLSREQFFRGVRWNFRMFECYR